MSYHYFNTVPVAAHRGNAKYFPENTLAAFRSALSLSPDMLETDLHMTSDGEIVIMHDHLVDRTTNGSGLVREKTYEQIRKLDAGSWKGEQFIGEKEAEKYYNFSNVIEIMKNRDLGHQDEMIGLYFEVESKRLLNSQYENKVFGWEQQANLEQAIQDLPF